MSESLDRGSPKTTYKNPSRKIPVNVIFCVRLVLRDHTIGIGKHRTMRSVTRLLTPVPMEKVTVFMHLAFLIFLSP